MTMTIGIRELSHHTGRVVTAIREGHTITLTDHGRPIATINPAAPQKRPKVSTGIAHSGDPTLASRTEELLSVGFGE